MMALPQLLVVLALLQAMQFLVINWWSMDQGHTHPPMLEQLDIPFLVSV